MSFPATSRLGIATALALLVAAASVGLTPRPSTAQSDNAPEEPAQERAPRYVMLDLGRTGEEIIGAEITDDAVRAALALIPASRAPDIVLLRFNSFGGMLREVPQLVDLITEELEPRGARVVAWVDTAISAAALTALGCDELIMTRGGTIGAAVAFKMNGGRALALEGEELERALQVGREIARRTGRDPRLIRAMQTPTTLSYDLDEQGNPTLRDDTDGRHVLSDGTTILTLSSSEARDLDVSIGTADTVEDALALLDAENAEDVGRLASGLMERHLGRASAAMDRIIAYDASARRSIDRARKATSDEARIAELEGLERTIERLSREVRQWPDVAAYLGLDAGVIAGYEHEIATLHRPVEPDE